MDIVSHALIGRAIASSPNNSKMNNFWIIFFSILPDAPAAFTYIYLGIFNSRPFGIALDTDWIGFREFHYFLSAASDAFHSIFLALIVIYFIIKYFKLPVMALLAYCSHIFFDLFSHTGEWSVSPLYPLQYQIDGFSDAWAWPFWAMAVSWVVLLIIIILIEIYHKHIH
ncbi:MAG: hypothetical protein US74_C0006G0006 [Parcubacteria group bacterium GW2011_GWA2_38_13]|nr:MAG: hypothetical protein US74_C0006G0006 [Parcubacteria group bacterium GW2011_GWA2_38_13]